MLEQGIIAVIFDFDDTLAADSTSGLLASLGVDVPDFWKRKTAELVADGWDPVPAYLYAMVRESLGSQRQKKITKEVLAQWGKKLSFYKGVTQIFTLLKEHAASVDAGVEVEFYLVSSGIGEVLRNTRIAKHFKDIWSSDFHYGENDEILFPKNVVSFTDKTRYLFQIAKGIYGPQSRAKPFEVNRKVERDALRIPFQQMIFVGDGYTDIPCFSLVRGEGGVAFAVVDPEDHSRWGRAWGFIEDKRISNLLPADYSRKSFLTTSLCMALESMVGKVRTRQRSYQG